MGRARTRAVPPWAAGRADVLGLVRVVARGVRPSRASPPSSTTGSQRRGGKAWQGPCRRHPIKGAALGRPPRTRPQLWREPRGRAGKRGAFALHRLGRVACSSSWADMGMRPLAAAGPAAESAPRLIWPGRRSPMWRTSRGQRSQAGPFPTGMPLGTRPAFGVNPWSRLEPTAYENKPQRATATLTLEAFR